MMHTQTIKSEIKEITSVTVVKEYFTDNTSEFYITIVVIHFCSIIKRQSTKQKQLPKVAHKTCDHTLRISIARASALTTLPLPLTKNHFEYLKIR
jgi:hypothetical protein